jgi:hypothetical protein
MVGIGVGTGQSNKEETSIWTAGGRRSIKMDRTESRALQKADSCNGSVVW